MSLKTKALAPFLAGSIPAVSAQTQLLPTWETHVTLTQRDLDMIRGAVTNQVHGKPVGTIASWNNPDSGNSGSIRLVKKLTRKNQQCEDIGYLVRSGGHRFTPSTIISSVVCSPTGPGKLREFD